LHPLHVEKTYPYPITKTRMTTLARFRKTILENYYNDADRIA